MKIIDLVKIEAPKKKHNVKKAIGIATGVTALALSFIPYEIHVEKGIGVDIKALVPRVTCRTDYENGHKTVKVQIRWFSFD